MIGNSRAERKLLTFATPDHVKTNLRLHGIGLRDVSRERQAKKPLQNVCLQNQGISLILLARTQKGSSPPGRHGSAQGTFDSNHHRRRAFKKLTLVCLGIANYDSGFVPSRYAAAIPCVSVTELDRLGQLLFGRQTYIWSARLFLARIGRPASQIVFRWSAPPKEQFHRSVF